MIHIVMTCTKEGELVSCEAKGHALFSNKGSDIVCSAVTTLLRTTLFVLESIDFIRLETFANERGTLSFYIKKKQVGDMLTMSEKSPMLVYAKIFLEKGLNTLCNEYPKHVSLELHIEEDVV